MKTLSSYRVLASILLLASALLTATPRAQFPTSLSGANNPTAGEPDVHPMIQNPAAVHCRDLGHRYEVVGDREQRGICTLPDGEACDAWAFLQGKCGQHYSYCAQQGYEVRTVRDGNDPFSPEYAVCVTSEGMVVGSVTELSNLSAKAMGCGGEAPSRGRPSVFEGGGEYVPPRRGGCPGVFRLADLPGL